MMTHLAATSCGESELSSGSAQSGDIGSVAPVSMNRCKHTNSFTASSDNPVKPKFHYSDFNQNFPAKMSRTHIMKVADSNGDKS